MQRDLEAHGAVLDPHEFPSTVPVRPTVASHGLGWAGLEAARFINLAGIEVDRPALTHHALILFTKPPDDLVRGNLSVNACARTPARAHLQRRFACRCRRNGASVDGQVAAHQVVRRLGLGGLKTRS